MAPSSVSCFQGMTGAGFLFAPAERILRSEFDYRNPFCAMGEKAKEVLTAVCLPLKDPAVAMGVPYTTMRNWTSGRAMPPESRAALAAFMRTHAARLVKLAGALEA